MTGPGMTGRLLVTLAVNTVQDSDMHSTGPEQTATEAWRNTSHLKQLSESTPSAHQSARHRPSPARLAACCWPRHVMLDDSSRGQHSKTSRSCQHTCALAGSTASKQACSTQAQLLGKGKWSDQHTTP